MKTDIHLLKSPHEINVSPLANYVHRLNGILSNITVSAFWFRLSSKCVHIHFVLVKIRLSNIVVVCTAQSNGLRTFLILECKKKIFVTRSRHKKNGNKRRVQQLSVVCRAKIIFSSKFHEVNVRR